VVERAPAAALFAHPAHPYTEGLLASIPPFDDDGPARLSAIEGTVPSPFDMPRGCPFHPRCDHAWSDCLETQPPLLPAGPHHQAACLRLAQVAA
jgi:oligopeptide/dipeptide ABC transporter ATP-binding protein